MLYRVRCEVGPLFGTFWLELDVFPDCFMRHNATIARDYDKKFEFVSPDARGRGRTAAHRYMPPTRKVGAGGTNKGASRGIEEFSEVDFKPRWWPTQDVWQ